MHKNLLEEEIFNRKLIIGVEPLLEPLSAPEQLIKRTELLKLFQSTFILDQIQHLLTVLTRLGVEAKGVILENFRRFQRSQKNK